MVSPTVARDEELRDLKLREAALRNDPDEEEIIVRDTSPRRGKETIYSMLDGEPIEIPRGLRAIAMGKMMPNGKPMFTGYQDRAPTYTRGEVKCFLHPDSPERPLLKEVGLDGVVCEAEHLASLYSKRIHAQHRHGKQWEAFQEYQQSLKDLAREARETKQLEATLALARGNTAAPVAVAELEPCDYPDCDYEGTPNQIRGHKMGAHK